VYVDPVQRRAQWKLVAVRARKKLSNGQRATKPARRRLAETAKKLKNTKIDKKKYTKTLKQKPKWGRRGMRRRDWGTGALGLRTSSKLLEPDTKGTRGGGMVEAIPPPL
jgi:hypothetical protein